MSQVRKNADKRPDPATTTEGGQEQEPTEGDMTPNVHVAGHGVKETKQ